MKSQNENSKEKNCCNNSSMHDQTHRCSEKNAREHTECCSELDAQGQENTNYCSAHDDQHPEECCRNEQNQVHKSWCQRESAVFPENSHTENEEIKNKLAEMQDKYIRLYAEFDNLKKRAAKERIELSNKANEKTLKEILPILDDFERGIHAFENFHSGTQQNAQQKGIKLIHDKLCALLKRFGVAEMELNQGSEFNTDLHEAIMQQPVDNEEMKGKIISVIEKGYLINDYVLRFSKVVIGV